MNALLVKSLMALSMVAGGMGAGFSAGAAGLNNEFTRLTRAELSGFNTLDPQEARRQKEALQESMHRQLLRELQVNLRVLFVRAMADTTRAAHHGGIVAGPSVAQCMMRTSGKFPARC